MKYFIGLTIILSTVIAGCSRETPDTYLTKAKQAYDQAVSTGESQGRQADPEKLFAPALESYRDLVRVYPDSLQAQEARFMIATILNHGLRRPAEAIDAYNEYLRANPAGEKAPVALFLIAYIYNNDLHKTDSASVKYNEFLTRYPNHELAASAQFELNTMGKSEEELLPKGIQPPPSASTKKSKGLKTL